MLKNYTIFFLLGAIFAQVAFCNMSDTNSERPIVIIIPSYNNKKWYKRNLFSVFRQRYQNYRVIYIDDCSTDGTYELVKDYIKLQKQEHHVTLLHNDHRKGALANIYDAVHTCDDRAIIVCLDADDWLNNSRVLFEVNKAYIDTNIWLVYSQFFLVSENKMGWNKIYTQYNIDNSPDRNYSPSHLRTFYAGLFKKIKKEDLFYEGDFFKMTYDMAIMLPMMEMAREGHIKFVPKILLDYNDNNPLSDHRVDKELQKKLDVIIRGMSKYSAIQILF